jgi:hypothetical protein
MRLLTRCRDVEAPDGSRVLTDYMAFGYFAGAPYDGIADPEELAARS